MNGHGVGVEVLGWIATATFVGSYLCKRASTLVKVQMAGAFLWVLYGALVRSAPVIAANILVLGAAAWKARKALDRDPADPAGSSGSESTQKAALL